MERSSSAAARRVNPNPSSGKATAAVIVLSDDEPETEETMVKTAWASTAASKGFEASAFKLGVLDGLIKNLLAICTHLELHDRGDVAERLRDLPFPAKVLPFKPSHYKTRTACNVMYATADLLRSADIQHAVSATATAGKPFAEALQALLKYDKKVRKVRLLPRVCAPLPPPRPAPPLLPAVY